MSISSVSRGDFSAAPSHPEGTVLTAPSQRDFAAADFSLATGALYGGAPGASPRPALFAARADMAYDLVEANHRAHNFDRYPRPNRQHYPYWFGEVRRFSRDGNEGYRYEGRPPQVDSLNDIIAHKHALDFARRDLMNTNPRFKRGEGYRDAALDVILAHHYLIARIYEWGSRNPNDQSLELNPYKQLVKDMWLESLSMMIEYEQYNDNDGWLRENLFRHLYRTLVETRLDNRYYFYRNLVEDIRQAIY